MCVCVCVCVRVCERERVSECVSACVWLGGDSRVWGRVEGVDVVRVVEGMGIRM